MGAFVGSLVGDRVGALVGALVGASVGALVGGFVGALAGAFVGAFVGAEEMGRVVGLTGLLVGGSISQLPRQKQMYRIPIEPAATTVTLLTPTASSNVSSWTELSPRPSIPWTVLPLSDTISK
jgi:hypothetical protein